ncbi:hypothetical protein VTG60DRAFT_2127 [Thermothelomyces hinnuleus]
MAPAFTRLLRRQYEDCTITEDGYIDEDSCYIPFWATRTGVIVKWSLFLGIIALIILYFLVAYIHLKQRLRKGLPPLGYHRFLVSRVTLAQVDPRYRPPPPNNFTYDPAERYYYDMYAMPPPVYDPNAPRPPKYEPPANSTKVEPNQSQGAQQGQHQAGESAAYGPPPGPPPAPSQPQDDYAPPPGPPPNAVQPQSSANPNVSRN